MGTGRYTYIDGMRSCDLIVKLWMVEKDARYVKRVVFSRLRRERSHDSALVYMSGFYNSHISTFLLIYCNLLLVNAINSYPTLLLAHWWSRMSATNAFARRFSIDGSAHPALLGWTPEGPRWRPYCKVWFVVVHFPTMTCRHNILLVHDLGSGPDRVSLVNKTASASMTYVWMWQFAMHIMGRKLWPRLVSEK